jgi:small-conductance mechanosensitive channel
VNRTIWRLFQEQGITIPVAQREISIVHASDRSPIAHDV